MSIKCLVSIKTSADTFLNFPTLPYPARSTHPTPTHPTKPFFILRYSTLLKPFSLYINIILFTKNLIKAQTQYFSPSSKPIYFTRQHYTTTANHSPTLSHPTIPHRTSFYRTVPYPALPSPALPHLPYTTPSSHSYPYHHPYPHSNPNPTMLCYYWTI